MTAGPLVIKIGGAGVDDPAAAPQLWRAVAELHRELDGALVLVHGGGRAVDAQLERLGMETRRQDGIRITPSDQLAQIVAILAGVVNKGLVGALQAAGVPSVGLTLGDGGSLRAQKATGYSFDPGRVGAIAGGDPRLLHTLLAARFLPVISSIGLDAQGQFLNINADDAAAGVAHLLHARALVLLTDVEGVRGEQGTRLESIDAAEIERLTARGVITGGMIPKTRAALSAARTSGVPTTIASWGRPEDLLRLARGQSVGTRVLAPRA